MSFSQTLHNYIIYSFSMNGFYVFSIKYSCRFVSDAKNYSQSHPKRSLTDTGVRAKTTEISAEHAFLSANELTHSFTAQMFPLSNHRFTITVSTFLFDPCKL